MDNGIGVIIGRFQVPYLHDGHKNLIDRVADRHGIDRVIFFVGTNELPSSPRNPLPFTAVQLMIREEYGPRIVIKVHDRSEDKLWSKEIDQTLEMVNKDIMRGEFTLYGSRDSFISHYSGKHECVEMAPEVHLSGTQLREQVGKSIVWNRHTREGAIFSATSQFPTSYQAADLAIVTRMRHRWYLVVGQKPGELGWRLPGGFSDPKSQTLQEDAAREGIEETHVKVDPDDLVFITSKIMDDFRYRGEVHCIKTALFLVEVDNDTFNGHHPGDDLAKTRAFDLSTESIADEIRPNHRKLVEAVASYLEENR